MAKLPAGTISVIFIAQRTDADAVGYAQAASAMDKLAATQEGYIMMDMVRGADGLGITVSYWESEHAAIRDAGLDRWYSDYSLHVAEITRSYDWTKP